MSEERVIKERNVFMVYFLMFITFGFYGIYWSVSTKEDMNSLGAEIPTAWLLVLPGINLYWLYKYSEAYACQVRKSNDPMVWFLINFFVGFVTPAFVQSGLNESSSPKPQGQISSQAA